MTALFYFSEAELTGDTLSFTVDAYQLVFPFCSNSIAKIVIQALFCHFGGWLFGVFLN